MLCINPLPPKGATTMLRTRVQRPFHCYRPVAELLEDRCLLNAGTLDPSFGNGGIVTTPVPVSAVITAQEAVQGDGKIVVVGEGPTQSVLVRYNPNGSLDASFGSGGVATI